MKTLRKSSLITLAVAALALLVASPVAKANDIVQVVTYPFTPTNYGPVDLGPIALFDSNLGSLNSVTLTFAGGVSGTIQFTNNSPLTSANVSGNDNGTLTLTSSNVDLTALFATPLTVTTNTATDTGLAPLATGPIHSVSGTNSTAGTAVNPLDFSIFEAVGGGTLDDLFYVAATGSSTVSASNGDGSAQYVTDASEALKIDYNYGGPGPVPEPGTLSLFGTGLIGLAGMLRHKFAK
jgi:hypothetical protein